MNFQRLILGWFLTILLLLASLSFLLLCTGCVTRHPAASPSNPSLSSAALTGRHIEDKAVIVEQWLRAN